MSAGDPARRRLLALLGASTASGVAFAAAPGSRAADPAAATVGPVLDVTRNGARGDDQYDDTRAIQRTIDACPEGGAVLFPGGRSYRCTNLKIKPGILLQGQGRPVLKALDRGDPRYFLATQSYADNVGGTADPVCEIDSLVINANNCKAIALAWRCFYGRVTRSRVFGALQSDVLVATKAIEGAAMPPGSMVNNRFSDNWFGAANDYGLKPPAFVFKLEDPSHNKATDVIFSHNYVSGGKERAVLFTTAAGLIFQGNHVYGGASEFRKGFMGFSCGGNYFEDDVILDDINRDEVSATFGPGNTVLTAVLARFGPAGRQIVSTGNRYFGQSTLRHCFNDSSMQLVSMGDVFDRADPIAFYDNAGRNQQPGSRGRVLVVNGILAATGKVWNAEFSGKGANGMK